VAVGAGAGAAGELFFLQAWRMVIEAKTSNKAVKRMDRLMSHLVLGWPRLKRPSRGNQPRSPRKDRKLRAVFGLDVEVAGNSERGTGRRGRKVASAQVSLTIVRAARSHDVGTLGPAKPSQFTEAKAIGRAGRNGHVARDAEGHPCVGPARIDSLDGRDPHQVLWKPASVGGVNRGLHRHRVGGEVRHVDLDIPQSPVRGAGIIAEVDLARVGVAGVHGGIPEGGGGADDGRDRLGGGRSGGGSVGHGGRIRGRVSGGNGGRVRGGKGMGGRGYAEAAVIGLDSKISPGIPEGRGQVGQVGPGHVRLA